MDPIDQKYQSQKKSREREEEVAVEHSLHGCSKVESWRRQRNQDRQDEDNHK